MIDTNFAVPRNIGRINTVCSFKVVWKHDCNFTSLQPTLLSGDLCSLFAGKKIKEAWINMFGYVIGGTELNPVRMSFPTSGAQQQTPERGQSPEVPVSSRELFCGQGSSNTTQLNALHQS